MDTTMIKVEFVTVYCNKIIKSNVSVKIPREAALIIQRAWHGEMPQHQAIVAHHLAANQVANCELILDSKLVGGISGMIAEDTEESIFLEINNVDE